MFILLALFLLLAQLFNGGFFPQEVAYLSMLGIGIGALATVELFRRPVSSTTNKWVLLTAGWLVIETFTSPVIELSTLAMVRYLLYAIIFFAGTTLAENDKYKLVLLFLGFTVANCVLAVGQELTSATHIWGLQGWQAACVPGRANGMFYNPNYLGSIAVAGEGMLLGWLYLKRPVVSKVKLGLVIASLLVVSEAIIASKSREACLFTGLVLITTCVFAMYQRSNLLAILASLVLVFQICSFYAHKDLVHHTADLTATTLNASSTAGENNRLTYWKGSLILWQQSPITGIHPQMLDARWPEVQPKGLQTYPFMAHSLPIQILCDLGVIGALFIGGFFLYWGRDLRQQIQSSNHTACLASIGAILLISHDLLDYSMFSVALGGSACLLVSLSLLVKPTTKSAGLISNIALVIIIGILGLRLVQENRYLYYAGKTNTDPKLHVIELVQASKWVPFNPSAQTALAQAASVIDDRRTTGQALLAANKLNPYDPEITFQLARFLYPSSPDISSTLMADMLKRSPYNLQILQSSLKFAMFIKDTNQVHAITARLASLPQFSQGFKARRVN